MRILIISALLLASACNAEIAPDPLTVDLQKLADAGNAEALYHLGMAYHVGAGVTRDRAAALKAFQRATAMGDPLAAYKLGCYYDGQGEGLVPDDPELALRYKLVAAKAGYALAQMDVAALLAQRGDIDAALPWLDMAADQGIGDALMGKASVYNGAPGVPKDPVKTAAYFRLYLDRSDGSSGKEDWLKSFRAGMTAEQRASADNIVSEYVAKPSPLTIKGLSGQQAARKLVSGG